MILPKGGRGINPVWAFRGTGGNASHFRGCGPVFRGRPRGRRGKETASDPFPPPPPFPPRVARLRREVAPRAADASEEGTASKNIWSGRADSGPVRPLAGLDHRSEHAADLVRDEVSHVGLGRPSQVPFRLQLLTHQRLPTSTRPNPTRTLAWYRPALLQALVLAWEPASLMGDTQFLFRVAVSWIRCEVPRVPSEVGSLFAKLRVSVHRANGIVILGDFDDHL
jgi:hypothetical protein